MTKNGKKILILSDSLCSSIKMKEFNTFIKNGYTYRKSFPGATVKDLAHYSVLTLQEDKPDTCIINIGSNNLNRNQPADIAEEIIKIVEICHKHGVNDVYVSAIPLRLGKEKAMNDVNNFLRARTFLNDFILIDNSNITRSHICTDKIHLNFSGTVVIAKNFIRAINGKRGD
jgi:lysophospholipase L1-like esterase